MDSEDGTREGMSSSLISAISLGVLILPLLALWTSSLSLARREDNTTPLAFTYMKIVYPVAFLALTFQFAHVMLEIAMRWILVPRGPNEIPLAEPHRMAYMSNRLDALSSTLLDVTDIFLILVLFELGNDLLEHVTGKATSFALVVRYTLLLPAAIVLYLAIATHIQSYSISSTYFSTNEEGESQLQEDGDKLGEWDTPLLTLWWAASWLKEMLQFLMQAVMTTLDLDIVECKLIQDYLYLVDDILDYWVRFLVIAHIFAMGLPGDKAPQWTLQGQQKSNLGEAEKDLAGKGMNMV
ncbi:hypothetical protein N0V84_012577 [Fusarium piperis]|uniref:Uncharacterized protein n=1 Tax=Fusarium piperis TaxID=1435070 RepID=A0A9W8W2L7_9HYPO|nr:hypothetical protein N0V84_012577 [Fusarium piperis]